MYQLRRDSGTWTDPASLVEAMAKIRTWTMGKRPFQLKVNGELGPELDRDAMLERVKARLQHLTPGSHPLVLLGNQLRIKMVAVEWEASNTAGTPSIDKVWTAVFGNPEWKRKNVVSWGIVNCRNIAGSSTWSQHAWGNGLDIHASFEVMDDLSKWLATEAKAGKLDIAQILFNQRAWTPSQGWHAVNLSTPHTDHVHVSGAPMMEGTPPCA